MKRLLLLILVTITSWDVSGQPSRNEIRQGNRLFIGEKFSESETAYRKALSGDPRSTVATFNLGDALYRQEKFEEALQQFESISGREASKIDAARAWHNLGNANLKAGKIDESIEAYKEALRKNPVDLDTKYNLAYAQNLKKQQQQQQQQPQDQNEQDQQDKDKTAAEQQKDQGQQQPQASDDKENQQSQPVKISKEDAKRLLEAIARNEKKVQEKVKKEKAAAARVRSIKDW